MNTSEYKIEMRKGIDDLQDIYPGLWTEWWTEKDWEKWNREKPLRAEHDKKYIAELKESGEFGKIAEYTMTFVYNPILDDPKLFTGSITLGNFRMTTIE